MDRTPTIRHYRFTPMSLALLIICFGITIDSVAQRQVTPSKERILYDKNDRDRSPALSVKTNFGEPQTKSDPGVGIITPGVNGPLEQIDPPSLQLDAGPAPASLPKSVKLQALSGAGGANGIAAPDTSLKTVTLTPRNPYVPNQASLGYNDADFVSMKYGSATFWKATASNTPYAFINLNLVKGKKYLIDIQIDSLRSQDFIVKYQGGEYKQSVDEGSEHVLVVVDAQKTGMTHLTLRCAEGYRLYAVEISRID